MISWLILTAGLMLGSWWAYTILGWGGYWAWDPVENSALMPWLAMTAFVHSIMVQKRRGMFRGWNMVIIIAAFTMAQMGMFINRGGPVPSVHSFAQSTMGWLFLLFMAVTLLASAAAFIWKSPSLRSRGRLESYLSRESAFLAQNALFLTVAFVTLWGTIFPVFSEAASDTAVTVGQPFFNRVNGPLMLGLLVLMGAGPLLPWRRASWRSAVKALRYPAAFALAVGRNPVRAWGDAPGGARGVYDVRRNRRRHRPGMDKGDYRAPSQRRIVPRRLRLAAVGEQTQIRRLYRPLGDNHAVGGRDSVVVLRRSAGFRHESRAIRARLANTNSPIWARARRSFPTARRPTRGSKFTAPSGV